MKVAISGANGYIAQNMIGELKKTQKTVIPIERRTLYNVDLLTDLLSGTDVVINLAGAPILQRWNDAAKKEIFRSRVEPTRNIVEAINRLPGDKKPSTFISASAVGIYSPDRLHSEESALFSDNFVGEVVKNWENASARLSPEVRKVIFRIGLILGKDASTIKKMLPIFEMGIGGKIGTGKQPFPFVHIRDVIRSICWAIENENSCGIYNLAAPENIDNKTFTQVLANSLHKPAFFTVPEFGLKLLYGEAATLLLQSAQVFPKRLLEEGYLFSFPDIKSCIAEITG